MAFTYDTKSLGTASALNPVTLSYTCGASARLLVVNIFVDGTTARSGGTPTWDGNNMSFAESQADSLSEGCIETWYYLAPATGSAKNISVPNSGGVTLRISASSYGATVPVLFDKAVGVNNLGTNPTTNIVTANAGQLIIGLIVDAYRNAPTNGANYTTLQTYDPGAYTFVDEYDLDAGAAGTIAINWVLSTSDWYSIVGATFYAQGTGSTSKSAYIKGRATSSTVKHALIVGGGAPTSSKHAYMYALGNADPEITRAVLLVGEITGGAEVRTSKHAYIYGKTDTSKHAYIKGCLGASSTSKHAYTRGGVSTSKHAYARGGVVSSSSKHAYLWGAGEHLVPDNDITTGSWKRETGTSGSLFVSVRDDDDATYVWYDNAVADAYFEVSLSNLVYESVQPSGNHYIHWRAKLLTGASLLAKCELRQGSSTVIHTENRMLSSVIQDFHTNLTVSEVSSITDYDDLRMRITIVGKI